MSSPIVAHGILLAGWVPYDPAFIAPFTIELESPDSTGRMGFSGWTAPNTPVGPVGTGTREINGWFSFGFTWT